MDSEDGGSPRTEAVLKDMPKLAAVQDNRIAEPTEAEAYDLHADDIHNFRAFLRSLLMHGAIGTTLGGCSSGVGQPQNLVIARYLEWDFVAFFLKMLPITAIVLPMGLITCVILEQSKVFGYGQEMPKHVRKVLSTFADDEYGKIHNAEVAELMIQGIGAIFLVLGLALHVTEVGFVGLAITVYVTAFNGIVEEHEVADAFMEAMPFVSLLVVFFGVVSIIQDQAIFEPIIDGVLALEKDQQPPMLFVTNGLLSMVSDNVFVATVFIKGVAGAYENQGVNGTMTRDHYETLAVSINMGTNLPSCATPNGQAAFLFILTSSISPLVHLTYGTMVKMAFP